MTQFRPYVCSLHSQLESYERMWLAAGNLNRENVIQRNVVNFQKSGNHSNGSRHFNGKQSAGSESGGGSKQYWNFHRFVKQQTHSSNVNWSFGESHKSSFPNGNTNFKKPSSNKPICKIYEKIGHTAASCFVLRDALGN